MYLDKLVESRGQTIASSQLFLHLQKPALHPLIHSLVYFFFIKQLITFTLW